MSLTLTFAMVAGTALFASDAPPGPPPPPPPPQEEPAPSPPPSLSSDVPRSATLQTMSEDQMMARLSELKANRPNIVGPIVLLSIGAVVAIPGIYFLISTLEVASAIGATKSGFVALFGAIAGVILGVFSAIFLIPAVVLLTVGGILLPLRLSAMSAANAEQEELERRLRTMPSREIGPPPPPPPAPMTNLVLPQALQTVGSF